MLVLDKDYDFPPHCQDGMNAHKITLAEVLRIVDEATEVTRQENNGRWRIDGFGDDDEPVRVIVDEDISERAVFVTVHLIRSQDKP